MSSRWIPFHSYILSYGGVRVPGYGSRQDQPSLAVKIASYSSPCPMAWQQASRSYDACLPIRAALPLYA